MNVVPKDKPSEIPGLLVEELAVFEAQRERLLADHAGKFALVKGADLIGTFDTEDNAYEEGLKRFENVPSVPHPVP